MKSFFKLSVLALALVALATLTQSCSNPFNPASKFVGKWRVVSQTYTNGKDVPADAYNRSLEVEFLGDFKSGVRKRVDGVSSFVLEVRDGGIAVLGMDTFHYSFSGNRLTLKEISTSAGMVLERE